MEPPKVRTSTNQHLALGSILVLCTLVYLISLSGPFVLDDFANIGPANLNTFTWPAIWETLTSNHSGMLGRPIPMLTFIANYGFFGDAPFSFKVTNLGLHLLCGIGLFFLGTRMLHQMHGQHASHARMLALLATALWLLHPLHVSTVLYVVQRMAQLSALFMIFGMLLYVVGRQRMLAGRKHGLLVCVLGIGLFTPLAALSKENGLMLPAFILLLEATVFRFTTLNHQQHKRLAFTLALLCVTPMLLGAGYVATHFEHFVVGYVNRDFTLPERLFTQVHALYFYLQLTFWPSLSAMGLYHDDFPITRLLDIQTVLMLAGLLGALLASIYWLKKVPLAALGVLWFFLAHAVESTFLPLEMVFEHRNYLAIWGLLLPTAYYSNQALARFHTTTNAQTLRAVIALVIVVILSMLTFFRVSTWKDQTTFTYSHYVDHPESTRALIGMAGLYLSLNDTSNARQLINKAQSLNPKEPGLALFNLYSYCNGEEPPDAVVTQAISPLKQGAWSIYASQMMYSLYLASNKAQCPNISRTTLLDFVHAALKFHPVPNMNRTLELHIAHAGLLADMGKNEEASKLFAELYNHPMKMPTNTRAALLRKVEESAAQTQ